MPILVVEGWQGIYIITIHKIITYLEIFYFDTFTMYSYNGYLN